jgi:hypothetical protein
MGATMRTTSRVKYIALFIIVFASSIASAASILLISKEPNAKNSTSFDYTYKYTCSNNRTGNIVVLAADDKSAEKQAEVKGKIACEEP